MDYTLSVFLPEIAMQGQQHQVSREELGEKAGLSQTQCKSQDAPLLVQMLKKMREGQTTSQGPSATSSPNKNNNLAAGNSAAAAAASNTEEVKQVSSTAKSPFRSSANSAALPNSEKAKKGAGVNDDNYDIEEDIVQDHEDIAL